MFVFVCVPFLHSHLVPNLPLWGSKTWISCIDFPSGVGRLVTGFVLSFLRDTGMNGDTRLVPREPEKIVVTFRAKWVADLAPPTISIQLFMGSHPLVNYGVEYDIIKREFPHGGDHIRFAC